MNKQKYIQYDKERLNGVPITDVARWLGMNIKKVGAEYKTQCPWHDDHTPSLSLVTKTGKNFAHCFSCDHHDSPIGLTMRVLGVDFKEACERMSNQFGIPPISGNISQHKYKYKPILQTSQMLEIEIEKKPMAIVPKEYVSSTLSTSSSFVNCLYQLFDKYNVDNACNDYCLGEYGDGGTIFWSIDYYGRARNGKVQYYETNIASDNFAHCKKGNVIWIGKQLQEEGIVPKEHELNNKCLFGEHLLFKYQNLPVALVESPKNAIIASLYCSDYVWVATGNKGAFKRENITALRDRTVMVIPDRDAIQEWTEKAIPLKREFNLTVSDMCEKMCIDGAPKSDIADIIIDEKLKKLVL